MVHTKFITFYFFVSVDSFISLLLVFYYFTSIIFVCPLLGCISRVDCFLSFLSEFYLKKLLNNIKYAFKGKIEVQFLSTFFVLNLKSILFVYCFYAAGDVWRNSEHWKNGNGIELKCRKLISLYIFLYGSIALFWRVESKQINVN